MTDMAERLREWSRDIVRGLPGAGARPAAILMQEAADEIERLRAALRDVIRDVDGYNALLTEKDRDGLTWVSVKRAREALGDE